MPRKRRALDKRAHKCPRCGKHGSGPFARWVRGYKGKVYKPFYYFAHSVQNHGKFSVKWCYLGKNPRGFRAKKRRKKRPRS